MAAKAIEVAAHNHSLNGSSASTSSQTAEPYDLVCVGFGPAGISLAVALADWREATGFAGPRTRFLERNSGPSWQSGLLVRGADINHHFLRDFATPRDPRSRFTFVNYIKQMGRLYQFGHLGGRVARTDWDAYTRWTADQLADQVSYNESVESILPLTDSGPNMLLVKTQNSSFLTSGLVVATGPAPRIPDVFQPHLGANVFHSANFLERIAKFDRDTNLTFTVVGSGQSAGEVLLHLYDRFPNAAFNSVQRGLAFPIVDVGHFSNEVYFPNEVEYFHGLSPEARQRAVTDFHKTNYSAVDADVSQSLYWRVYEDSVLGTQRVRMLSRRQPRELRFSEGRHTLLLEDVYTGAIEPVRTDVIILCTGYSEALFPTLLKPLRRYVVTDDLGGPEVAFDYRVKTTPEFSPLVYISGISERTHGASDSLSLSMSALKAERILNSFLSNWNADRKADRSIIAPDNPERAGFVTAI